MFIPLAAFSAARLAENARINQSGRRLDFLRVERDAFNRPWLVASDARILIAFTWDDQDGAELLKRLCLSKREIESLTESVRKAEEKSAGFSCEIPAALACLVYYGWKASDLNGFSNCHADGCVALVENQAAPLLILPSDGAVLQVLACTTTVKDGSPETHIRDLFPDWRKLIEMALADLSRGKSTDGFCYQQVILGPECLLDLASILDDADLDCCRLEIAETPVSDGRRHAAQQVRFSAWNSSGSRPRLQACGSIMPVQTAEPPAIFSPACSSTSV